MRDDAGMRNATAAIPAAEAPIAAADKAMPAEAIGIAPDRLAASGVVVGDLWTPVLVLSAGRLRRNADWFAAWCRREHVECMPHGKTTMAPQLWRMQLAAGASGITVATPWQLRVALAAGIRSVQLANQLVDAGAIGWLAREQASAARGGESIRVWSWVDDVRAVDRIERVLEDAGARVRLDVLVELGVPGARTGARSIAAATEVAAAVDAAPHLRLAGVAGYEGALAHDRSTAALDAVEAYVHRLVALHDAIAPRYDDGDVVVTAGGSAYPEIVARVFRESGADAGRRAARYVLRSGAYVVHDDGFYHAISPFDTGGVAGGPADGLAPAARGLTRVLSQPEPGLALLDGGKRDFPYDEGLPRPLAVLHDDRAVIPLDDAEISAMNDQHAFLRYPADLVLAPGDVVVLGLSHPCTMFDKWRRVPLVEEFAWDAGLPDLRAPIVGVVDTEF